MFTRAKRAPIALCALCGEQTAASHLIGGVTSMQAYLADPDNATRDLRDKTEETFRKHWQVTAAQKQTAQPDAPLDALATITFRLSAEALAEDREPPFPPNPWRI